MNNISSFINSQKLKMLHLNDPERILLWAIREWVINIKIAKDPRPKLIHGFSKVLIQESVMPFDKIMRLVSYQFNSPIDIRCHCSNLLGRTEIDILCLISVIQNKSEYNLDVIARKMNKEHFNQFLNLSKEIADAFQRANLLFLVRDTIIKEYFSKKIKTENQVIHFDFKNKKVTKIY